MTSPPFVISGYALKFNSYKCVLELAFDDIFVKIYNSELYLKTYSRVLHAQDFPKRVTMDVYCNV